jgi:hypothetical protein
MSKTHEDWQGIQPDESWPVMTWLAATWRVQCESDYDISLCCYGKPVRWVNWSLTRLDVTDSDGSGAKSALPPEV